MEEEGEEQKDETMKDTEEKVVEGQCQTGLSTVSPSWLPLYYGDVWETVLFSVFELYSPLLLLHCVMLLLTLDRHLYFPSSQRRGRRLEEALIEILPAKIAKTWMKWSSSGSHRPMIKFKILYFKNEIFLNFQWCNSCKLLQKFAIKVSIVNYWVSGWLSQVAPCSMKMTGYICLDHHHPITP